jgi:hypothetical protein
VLAEARLNPGPDSRRDHLFPRADQASIGSFMLSGERSDGVLDWDSFSDIARADPAGLGAARWIRAAAPFFSDLAAEEDFRIARMRLLVVFLIDLLETLLPGQVDRISAQTASRWLREFGLGAGDPAWKSGFVDIDQTAWRLDELARSGEGLGIAPKDYSRSFAGRVPL